MAYYLADVEKLKVLYISCIQARRRNDDYAARENIYLPSNTVHLKNQVKRAKKCIERHDHFSGFDLLEVLKYFGYIASTIIGLFIAVALAASLPLHPFSVHWSLLYNGGIQWYISVFGDWPILIQIILIPAGWMFLVFFSFLFAILPFVVTWIVATIVTALVWWGICLLLEFLLKVLFVDIPYEKAKEALPGLETQLKEQKAEHKKNNAEYKQYLQEWNVAYNSFVKAWEKYRNANFMGNDIVMIDDVINILKNHSARASTVQEALNIIENNRRYEQLKRDYDRNLREIKWAIEHMTVETTTDVYINIH